MAENDPSEKPLSKYVLAVTAAWVIGSTLFYLMRFSVVFYHANKAAIDGFLKLSR